jgi:hypothetical protein
MTARKIILIVVGVIVVLFVLSIAAVGLAPGGGARDIRPIDDPECSGVPTHPSQPDFCVITD